MKKSATESGPVRLKRLGRKMIWVEVSPEQHRDIRMDAAAAELPMGKFLLDCWAKHKEKRRCRDNG